LRAWSVWIGARARVLRRGDRVTSAQGCFFCRPVNDSVEFSRSLRMVIVP